MPMLFVIKCLLKVKAELIFLDFGNKCRIVIQN